MSPTPGLTTIIIPTYNHAAYLRDAIESALAQRPAPVEILVIDDGSTDATDAVLAPYHENCALRVLYQNHAGPSAARNRGIEEARGEFVMFLDADDVIAPTKVARQLEAMAPEIGWVLCDVRIEDEAKGRTMLASEQYGYRRKNLGGWIQPQLAGGNWIPIMSPLVRTSVFEDARVRFGPLPPEDWYFWHAVAGAARVAYVPEALATYRHRKTGRSRIPMASRRVQPTTLEQPLRLNLGCGTPDTRSWHPIGGMVNLDKSIGWRFEDGLHDFGDHTVSGITISHSLMYVPEDCWPAVFAEFARVLVDGGVVRITEDDTASPGSRTHPLGWQGSEPAVTLTSAARTIEMLERVGLAAREVDRETTGYSDRSLMQAQHGDPPNVFFVEGTRVPGVLFSPHNDDETLFAAFTILKHRPRVVVCYPSERDYGAPELREAETRDACSILGAAAVEQWAGGDIAAAMREYDARARPTRVWAPDEQCSHGDHRIVAVAARMVFGDRVRTTFHTYDLDGKVRRGRPVPYEPEWVLAKLRALARYESQATHPRAGAFFVADLLEYQGGKP